NSNKKWNNNNNGRNHTSSPIDKHVDLVHEDHSMTKLMHDRMLFLLGNLVGHPIEITVRDGSRFEGIFHSASTEGDLAVCLKYARKIYDPNFQSDQNKTNPNPIKDTLMFFPEDLVEISASNMDFTLPDASDHDLNSSPSGNWDQFAANERLFGLKTDFDEEIYTTHLNRSAPDYKDREKKAIKMANEIQKTTSSNVHILEERGYMVEDHGLDEEDLYGAVVRNDGSPSRYIPPALRNHSQPPQQSRKDSKMSVTDKLHTNDIPKSAGSNHSPLSTLPIIRRGSNDKNHDKTSEQSPSKHKLEKEVATTFRHFAMMEKDKLQAKKQALQKIEKDGLLAGLKMFHQTFKLNVPIPADLFPLLSKGKKSADVEQNMTPENTTEENKKKSVNASPVQAATPLPSTQKSTSPSPTTTSTASTIPATTNANNPSTTKTNTNHSPAIAPAPAPAHTFKFNVKASAFKPNPSAAAFVPAGVGSTSHHDDNNAFFNGKHVKKGNTNEHLTMLEAFTPSFKENDVPANTIGPTWPFGNKPYRVQFNQFTHYEDDVFTGYPSPNYSYAYPQYRYPQYVPGMPQMTVQQGAVPYMSPPAVAYSPQMTNVSPHGSPYPQGFPSPQRSPMISQGIPPQVYPYQGAPMMMRYTTEMMPNNGNGPHVMMQRPTMMDTMQYPPHHHEAHSPGK
ncbi:LsmAD domain-containing protein, partial [Pilobolus umbonatus]